MDFRFRNFSPKRGILEKFGKAEVPLSTRGVGGCVVLFSLSKEGNARDAAGKGADAASRGVVRRMAGGQRGAVGGAWPGVALGWWGWRHVAGAALASHAAIYRRVTPT